MMILVTGGSGSGKSSFAEKRILELCCGSMPMYYLATMQVYGEEGRQKVKRHRKMRAGKGFSTIEQCRDIDRALEQMESDPKTRVQEKQAVVYGGALLECISNLTANEMFTDQAILSEQDTADKIIREIVSLKDHLSHLVIVTGNVFEDGKQYDPSTMAYIRAMGRINSSLAAMADEVWESVAGIGVRMK